VAYLKQSSIRSILFFALAFFTATAALLHAPRAIAQTTLGGITGVVSDPSGSVIPGATVTAVSEGTSLTRTAVSNSDGAYSLVNLPIGTYTLTFTRDGFAPEKFPGIVVQADRTVTLPASLKVGGTTDSVTVEVNPLLNAVDTTNGYVLDKAQIQNIPLPTGSFTGLATQSPGVNAELPSGTGANDGLGNLPIWANGQRDTSNSFSLNGVDSSNLFNGKSTSQVGSARVINSTGVSSSTGAGGIIPSAASIYLSIGNAIPTPAPETIQEVRVTPPCMTLLRALPPARTSISAPPPAPTIFTARSTRIAAPTGSMPLPSSSSRTRTSPAMTKTHNYIAIFLVALSAAPSSRTSSSVSSPTSISTSPIRPSVIRCLTSPSA
jgi:hypothetical protein